MNHHAVATHHSKRWRRCSGRTRTEVMAVFFLMLILGLSVFSLATAGSEAYRKAEAFREAQGEVRIALSFVQMKLRQSDVSGAIGVAPNPVNGEMAIVLTEWVEEKNYETWIYHDDGWLREALILAGEAFDNDYAFPVAELDGFVIAVNEAGSGLMARAWSEDGRERPVTGQISMAVRSGGVR